MDRDKYKEKLLQQISRWRSDSPMLNLEEAITTL